MSFMLRFFKLSFVLKVCAAAGYGIALFQSRDSITSVPFPLIGLGIFVLEFLPVFRNREFKLLYFWVLYAILAYSLVTYHELDVCLVEACVGDELTSILSTASTGLLWATVDISSKKNFVSQVAKPGFFSNYKADETIELRWV
tara:strand:- start:58 stop:486 length:429 start_codon:yes stop_codon:yes gene_type:complete